MGNNKLKIKATAKQLRFYNCLRSCSTVSSRGANIGGCDIDATGWKGAGLALSAMITANVGHNFRLARQTLGLSLADVKTDLFKTCGFFVNISTLSSFESGKYIGMGLPYACNLYAYLLAKDPLLEAAGFPLMGLEEFLFFRLDISADSFRYTRLTPNSLHGLAVHPNTLIVLKEMQITKADSLTPEELRERFKAFPDRVSS